MEMIRSGWEMDQDLTFIMEVLLSFNLHSNTKVLTLKHLLHVSSITKNLLSVSQFAKDNKVFFEFFPNYCCVRDQATHNILMQGRLEGGLYVFDPPHVYNSKPLASTLSSRFVTSNDSLIKLPN